MYLATVGVSHSDQINAEIMCGLGKGAVGEENADRIGFSRGCFARTKIYPRREKAMGQGFDVGLNGQNSVAAIREYLGDGKSRALAQVVCVGKIARRKRAIPRRATDDV